MHFKALGNRKKQCLHLNAEIPVWPPFWKSAILDFQNGGNKIHICPFNISHHSRILW